MKCEHCGRMCGHNVWIGDGEGLLFCSEDCADKYDGGQTELPT